MFRRHDQNYGGSKIQTFVAMCINTIIVFLDIIHRSAFIETLNISETAFRSVF
jgi:hypothetical protein